MEELLLDLAERPLSCLLRVSSCTKASSRTSCLASVLYRYLPIHLHMSGTAVYYFVLPMWRMSNAPWSPCVPQIHIGDVGYFAWGRFCSLFNATRADGGLGADRDLALAGLPANYEPLRWESPRATRSYDKNDLPHGNILHYSSLS